MDYGNVALQYGKTNGSVFSVTFTDVALYDDAVEFWFNPDELAEQSPSVLSTQRVALADGEIGLYGSYGLQIKMKNNVALRMVFEIKDKTVFNGEVYELESKEKRGVNSVQEFFDAALSHKGGFQINVNSLDVPEIEQIGGLGMEFHDLYFRDVKPLANDELIAFGNDSIEATKIREDGVPCFPMECNAGLYLNKSKIDFVEKLDKDEFADMFELGISTAIYNVYMLADDLGGKRNIVTIGFID
ncbi:hypothetical protein [Anaerotignum sp.]|uniref:hypothetical protein n=1 Tax=Anaerotignum sp. TaxID=2039241 RepID=UPI00289E4549|nr:hypothetical protein [Anaerotignum sp.]